MPATLGGYIRHVDLFGPECVLETAAAHVPGDELAQLRAYLGSLERAHRWRRGHWEERPSAFRPCEHCGLDLPANARSNVRYHRHCRVAAKQRRYRARHAAQGDTPPNPERGIRRGAGSPSAGPK